MYLKEYLEIFTFFVAMFNKFGYNNIHKKVYSQNYITSFILYFIYLFVKN